MAIRKLNPLGKTSGKIGNTVSRIRYGKEIVYSKPDKVNISSSPKAVAERTKFSFTVRLARLINTVPELSTIWKNSKITGTNAYQKLIKHNSKFTSANGLTTRNIITPRGIDTIQNSLIIDSHQIRFNSVFDRQVVNCFTSIFILLFLYSEKENELLLINSNNIRPIEDNCVYGTISLGESDREKISHYKNAVILSCFTSEKNNFGSINWTTTIPFEISLEAVWGKQNIGNNRLST